MDQKNHDLQCDLDEDCICEEENQQQETRISPNVLRRRGPEQSEFDKSLEALKRKFNSNKPWRK